MKIIATCILFFLGIFYVSGAGHSVILAVYDEAHSHHSHDTDDTGHEFYHADDITPRGKLISTHEIVFFFNRFIALSKSQTDITPRKIGFQPYHFHEKQRLAFFETIRLLL